MIRHLPPHLAHLDHLAHWLPGMTGEQRMLLGSVGVLLSFLALQRPEFHDFILKHLKARRHRRRAGLGIEIGGEWVSDLARLRHTQIVGATGTGKTVLMQKLLFADLKRGYGAIVVDPKGERSFYDSVKAYCQSVGRGDDLYYLSATFPDESVIWNPCGLGNASELQTKFFNSAIYNEPHYAKACEFGLLRTFLDLTARQKEGFAVPDLIRELERIARAEKDTTLSGLFYDLNNLASGEWGACLACQPRKDVQAAKEISLLDLVTSNKILFVDLPTEGKKVQSARLGRLLTQEIILISGMRKRNAALLGDKPFSVFIDEFDAFATESFASFLNKGRSSQFMIHLAHQTLSDLKIVSPEFAGQILGNTNIHFIFREDDPDDAEHWARYLGTKTVVRQTYRMKDGSQTGESSNRTAQEFIVAPDTIKRLPIGQCVLSQKTEGQAKVITVPFEEVEPSKNSGGPTAAHPEGRGVGERPGTNTQNLPADFMSAVPEFSQPEPGALESFAVRDIETQIEKGYV